MPVTLSRGLIDRPGKRLELIVRPTGPEYRFRLWIRRAPQPRDGANGCQAGHFSKGPERRRFSVARRPRLHRYNIEFSQV